MLGTSKIARRDAERLLTITCDLRMVAEAAFERFNLPGYDHSDPFIKGSLAHWQQCIKSLNWIDSQIQQRTMD